MGLSEFSPEFWDMLRLRCRFPYLFLMGEREYFDPVSVCVSGVTVGDGGVAGGGWDVEPLRGVRGREGSFVGEVVTVEEEEYFSLEELFESDGLVLRGWSVGAVDKEGRFDLSDGDDASAGMDEEDRFGEVYFLDRFCRVLSIENVEDLRIKESVGSLADEILLDVFDFGGVLSLSLCVRVERMDGDGCHLTVYNVSEFMRGLQGHMESLGEMGESVDVDEEVFDEDFDEDDEGDEDDAGDGKPADLEPRVRKESDVSELGEDGGGERKQGRKQGRGRNVRGRRGRHPQKGRQRK